jgi:hypothetical protein
MKHAVVQLADGTEVDPNDFQDRCGAILNLVRATAIAVNPEMHSYDNVLLDDWGTHYACMGIATLLESLETDIANYFGEVATKRA